MKVVREITYEGTEAQLRRQMAGSLEDGTFRYLTTITVRTVSTDLSGLTGQKLEGWHKQLDTEE